MFKSFKLKSPIAIKEINISKQKSDYFYMVNIIAYGTWYTKQCRTLHECFTYIRKTFNIRKDNNGK